MGLLKKYVTCMMTFFHSPMSHFVNFTLSPLWCFSQNNKPWNEGKEHFLYIWLLQRITLYQGRQKILSLDTIAFLDMHVCKKPMLTK